VEIVVGYRLSPIGRGFRRGSGFGGSRRRLSSGRFTLAGSRGGAAGDGVRDRVGREDSLVPQRLTVSNHRGHHLCRHAEVVEVDDLIGTELKGIRGSFNIGQHHFVAYARTGQLNDFIDTRREDGRGSDDLDFRDRFGGRGGRGWEVGDCCGRRTGVGRTR
jgi:hypothetical protein